MGGAFVLLFLAHFPLIADACAQDGIVHCSVFESRLPVGLRGLIDETREHFYGLTPQERVQAFDHGHWEVFSRQIPEIAARLERSMHRPRSNEERVWRHRLTPLLIDEANRRYRAKAVSYEWFHLFIQRHLALQDRFGLRFFQNDQPSGAHDLALLSNDALRQVVRHRHSYQDSSFFSYYSQDVIDGLKNYPEHVLLPVITSQTTYVDDDGVSQTEDQLPSCADLASVERFNFGVASVSEYAVANEGSVGMLDPLSIFVHDLAHQQRSAVVAEVGNATAFLDDEKLQRLHAYQERLLAVIESLASPERENVLFVYFVLYRELGILLFELVDHPEKAEQFLTGSLRCSPLGIHTSSGSSFDREDLAYQMKGRLNDLNWYARIFPRQHLDRLLFVPRPLALERARRFWERSLEKLLQIAEQEARRL